MKRPALLLFVAIAFSLAGFAHRLYAQTNPYPLPRIVFFASDVVPTELAGAETLQMPVQLSWRVDPLMQHYRVMLHVYQDNAWQSLLFPASASLPASGTADLLIRQPSYAMPPTVRLVVLDEDDTLLNQRVMLLAYDYNDEAPLIATFHSSTASLDYAALSDHAIQVEVAWWIRYRQPDMLIEFEQLMGDGRAVSLDLPRPNAWIPSQGSGYLTPILPAPGELVQLRLRLIRSEDDTILAEKMLPPITIVDSEAPAASPVTFDAATFCDDPRALELITALRHAVRHHDGELFASLVAPQGLYMALERSHTNHLTPEEVRGFFDDRSMRSWGVPEYGPTDAPPIQASLAETITTQLEIDLLPGKATIACDDYQDSKRSPGDPYPIVIPEYEIEKFYSVLRPGPPGWEFNYSGWGLVFEYWQDQLTLLALANYTWIP